MRISRTVASLLTLILMTLFIGCGGNAPKGPGGNSGPDAVPTPVTDLTLIKPDAELPYFEVKLMGNTGFISDTTGGIRIITYSPVTGDPVEKVPVSIYLTSVNPKDKAFQKPVIVFSERTDANGTVNAQFPIGGQLEGSYRMQVTAGYGKGAVRTETDINVVRKFKLYLSVDKPMYQPGQVMNMRVLALSVPSMKPVEDRDVLLEVKDGKGNKVFKKILKSSKFGVVSAQFQLADQVNGGDYNIEASIDKEIANRQVQVKRYVLPKFKVTLEKDRNFYGPGDTIKGTVSGLYFFGKSVAGGRVMVKLNSFDSSLRTLSTVQGTTDKEGHFRFQLKIPETIPGIPLEKGNGKVLIEAVIVDNADHRETTYSQVAISNKPLRVEMFPESGQLKSGIENRIFVLCSYPDGTPVKTTLDLTIADKKINITTDESGISSFTFTPAALAATITQPVLRDPVYEISSKPSIRAERRIVEDREDFPGPGPRRLRSRPYPGPRISRPIGYPINFKATTHKGETVTDTLYLSYSNLMESIILRTDRPTYKVGDTINFEIMTAADKGSAYLDIIRNNQVILTRAYPLSPQNKKFSLEATHQMTGLVSMNCYIYNSQGVLVRDTRNLLIKSADDLNIKTVLDSETYRPGQEAKISFKITDLKGNPVASAMAVDIVDEAVFAMGQMTPGLEKVYFAIEKQLLAPAYQVREKGLKEMVLEDPSQDIGLKTLNQIILTKIPDTGGFTFSSDSFAGKLQDLSTKMSTVTYAVERYKNQHQKYPEADQFNLLVGEKLLDLAYAVDPWGTPFYLTASQNPGQPPAVASAGPDGKKGTADDITYPQVLKLQRAATPVVSHLGYDNEGKDLRRYSRMEIQTEADMTTAAPSVSNMKAQAEKSAPAPDAKPSDGGGELPARIREYFPETLYSNPAIITDENGAASITVKMADSITSWRMATFASSARGMMGNSTSPIRVFQDFFVDLDLPVAFTNGDEVSVPVAVHNYLKTSQQVELSVDTSEKWFELADSATKVITMEPDQVKAVYFRIKIKKSGAHAFMVKAKGTTLSDVIRRTVLVSPNGRMFTNSRSDIASADQTINVNIPENALDDSSSILVRLYPGIMSQVVDGLDKIFRMPYGCFEQTTAATYPNVLVLDYLKKQKKIDAQLQMKAEGYVNNGYQRLLSFEVPGGGFSLYGQAPAVTYLTAIGIMEFKDMSKVHTVDEAVIARAQRWLMSQQQGNGSFGDIQQTAYIAWALTESGYEGDDLNRTITYLKQNVLQQKNPYLLALTANVLATKEPDGQFTKEVLDALADSRTASEKSSSWNTKLPTVMHSYGPSATIETTALAAMAFMKVRGREELAQKAINFIIQNKDAYGTWHSTQSTVLAMKALITAHQMSAMQANATVTISVNDQKTETFKITPEDFDVYRQADFTTVTKKGENKVKITVDGKASCYYQVVTTHYEKWAKESPAEKPLSITVTYDRTNLKKSDTVTVTAYVRNNSRKPMNNVMLNLGIPPGFSPSSSDLDAQVRKTFARYDMTPQNILIYTDSIKEGQTLSIKYRLTARLPIKTKTPESIAYQYYDPTVTDTAVPVLLEVKN